MHMREISFDGQLPIDSYGPGGFRIGGEWLEGSRLVLPGGHRPLGPGLDETSLAPLLGAATEIDIVVIGQGAELRPLPRHILGLIEDAGLGVELMSTPSACRTYNVLLAEGRRVAAVLTAL